MIILPDSSYIIELILSKKDFLPKKQKILCEYIVENYNTIGLLTITGLADKAGVGTTTVMRVIKTLGYEGFNEFKKEFHHFTINSGAPAWWHLQKAFEASDSEVELTRVEKSWKEINNVLNETLNETVINNIDKAVQLILDCKIINVLGLRTCKVAAIYFENLLTEFYPKTRQLSYEGEFIFDRILQFKEGDLLVIFANSPFTTLTLKAAEYCYEKGHPIILITDDYTCPIISHAEVVLYTKASDKQYTIVPTIALLESLVIEIGKRTKEHSIEHLEKLGELLKRKNITI